MYDSVDFRSAKVLLVRQHFRPRCSWPTCSCPCRWSCSAGWRTTVAPSASRETCTEEAGAGRSRSERSGGRPRACPPSGSGTSGWGRPPDWLEVWIFRTRRSWRGLCLPRSSPQGCPTARQRSRGLDPNPWNMFEWKVNEKWMKAEWNFLWKWFQFLLKWIKFWRFFC